MNENSKTLAFVGAAVVLLGLGVWASIPTPDPDVTGIDIGKEFFPEFTDPLKVSSASIVDLDAESDVKHDLKVVRNDGQWELNPGKQGYPQVSTDRLADVVKAVIGVKKLAIVTDNPELHRQYAVVDPTNEAELKTGTDGVGKRVTLKDEGGTTLVDLILGKADEKNAKIVFVRKPGQARVYSTELDAERLSPNFSDWAVGDLLQTKDRQLETVRVLDYGIDKKNVRQAMPGQGGMVMMSQRTVLVERAKADFERKDGKWAIGHLELFDAAKNAYVERKAAADEEIEITKLDDLQRALTDLKIVDAVRKPKVLAADLQLDKIFLDNPASPVWKDEESFEELQAAGFRLNPKGDKEFEIVSHDGDMMVGFANGIRYHLRFGDITGKGRAVGAEEGKPGADKPAEPAAEAAGDGAAEGSNTAPNRYLMVMATFDESLVPKPELTKIPEPAKPADAKPAETKPAEKKEPAAKEADKKDADKKDAEKKEPEKKEPATTPEPAKSEPVKPETKSDAKPAASNDAGGSCGDVNEEDQLAQAEAPKPADKPADAKQDEAPAAEAKAVDKPAAETKADAPKAEVAKPAEEKKAGDKQTETAPDAKAAAAPPAEPTVVEPPMTPEERKRIEAENKKKQEKYEADIKAGREKAKELNTQYAAWFYVVSDATFRAIHLEPASLLKKKAPAGEAAAPAAGIPGLPGMPPGGLMPQMPK
ncbi:MAG: hypothetical protein C0483_11880 [Pirellula sp.]|nr:hypothetical protein [Pirellula sp.]